MYTYTSIPPACQWRFTPLIAAILVCPAAADPAVSVNVQPAVADEETDLIGTVRGAPSDTPLRLVWRVGREVVQEEQIAPAVRLQCELGDPELPAGLRFVAGRFGQGIELGQAGVLELPAPPYFDQTQGTLSFWLKPAWNGDDGLGHMLFYAEGWPAEYRFFVQKEPAPYQGLVFYIAEPGGKSHGVWTAGTALRAGQWYHVRVYWELQAAGGTMCRMGMYLNGRLVDDSPSDPSPIPPGIMPATLVFGRAAAGQPADAVLDEIVISKQAPAQPPAQIDVSDPTVLAQTRLYATRFQAGDRVSLSVESDAQVLAAESRTIKEATGVHDVYGGWRALRGEQTGFFHAQEIGGRWWLISPEGHAFYALGTDHARFEGHWCEKLGYAPYGRKNSAKYGSEAAWTEQTLARLKQWNFNALTAGHSTSLRHQGLAHTEFLSLGAGFAGQDGLVEKTTWTGFPNVFSPEWERYCNQRAAASAAWADDPWLLAYFIDNELEWYGKTYRESGIFEEAFRKPPTDTAKQALVTFLRERHGTIAKLNQTWGTSYASFDALAASTEPPDVLRPELEPDWRGFLRLVADRYFRISTEAIRKYDPNHMIIGCRFAGQAPGIWDIAGRYCDVVTLNYYGRVDLENEVAIGVEDLFTQWHEEAGKPLWITEWSFPALDSGLPCEHGAGERFDTQQQRAKAFDIYQRTFLRLPFMVGSDFFMWVDEPALGISSTFPEDSNYGLVNEDDVPYEPLVTVCERLQGQVYQIHSGRAPELSVSASRGSLVVTKTGPEPVQVELVIWLNNKESRRTLSFRAGRDSRRLPIPPAPTAGAALFLAEVDPEDKTAEGDRRDNRAYDVQYGFGDVPQARIRAALTVANLLPQVVEGAVVELPLAALARRGLDLSEPGLQVGDADQGLLDAQKDDLDGDGQLSAGDGWAVHLNVPARSGAALGLGPDVLWPAETTPPQPPAAQVTLDGTAFAASNGLLRLERAGGGGNLVDTVSLGDMPVGLLRPLMHQQAGARDWWAETTDVERVTVHNGPVRCVLDIVATRRAAPVSAGPLDGPFDYRCAYRLMLTPGSPVIESRLLWVENTDPRPWRLADYFHYAQSKIGGSAGGDEPALRAPNYYLKMGVWGDEQVGAYWGCFAPKEDDCSVTFWTSEGEGGAVQQHADARRSVNRDLQPGERYEQPQPVFRLFAVRKTEKPGAPWADLAQQLRALDALIVNVQP